VFFGQRQETFSTVRASNNTESVGTADDECYGERGGQEGMTMIRRDMVVERDQRVVKWSLIAAVVALSLGYIAETSLERNAANASPVAGQTVEVTAPVTAATSG
jgi:hypothetical protein